MFKLFARYYLVVVVFALAVVGLMYLAYTGLSWRVKEAYSYLDVSSHFQLVEQQLEKHPKDQWNNFLQQLSLRTTVPLSVITLEQAQKLLSPHQFARLKAGELVSVFNGHTRSDPQVTVYKKVEGEARVLKFIDVPSKLVASSVEMMVAGDWYRALVAQYLKQFPVSQWPRVGQKLSHLYSVPMRIVPLSTQHLSATQKTVLDKYKALYLENQGQISVAFLLPHDYLLQFGPIAKPWLQQHLLALLAVAALLLLAMLMWLWVFPHYRILVKLKALAKSYGQGRFEGQVAVRKGNLLYDLNQDLVKMGNNIQALLKSNKELTNTVSHELRTPLTSIQLAAEAMVDAPVEKRERYSQKISKWVDELDGLVDEMLTFARFERETMTLSMKVEPLSPLLESEVGRWQERAEDQGKSVVLNWKEEHAIELAVDAHWFRRALSNLLGNALKYAKGQVAVNVWREAEHCYIAVDDDGPGIPPAQREKVFAAFARLNEETAPGKGYGLGLAIVSKIVAAHQGRVSAQASPLGGARMLIEMVVATNK